MSDQHSAVASPVTAAVDLPWSGVEACKYSTSLVSAGSSSSGCRAGLPAAHASLLLLPLLGSLPMASAERNGLKGARWPGGVSQ